MEFQKHSGVSTIYSPSTENISTCAQQIKEGNLVAIPTETVYGLGANALNEQACLGIFKAKGRPLTDPLIVHVCSLQQAEELIDQNQEQYQLLIQIFKALANQFWPGPLTIVVKANLDKVPLMITASTGYVGLRMPNSQVALELIRQSGLPIAAPSANKFGHVSPSRAQHVFDDFNRSCDYNVAILDGGPCSFGIESTVLKICLNNILQFTILRQGGVSQNEIYSELIKIPFLVDENSCSSNQKIKFSLEVKKHSDFKEESQNLEGPGQFLRHYSPNIDSYLLQKNQQFDKNKKVILVDFGSTFQDLKSECVQYFDLSISGSYLEAIQNLYDVLREAETNMEAELVFISDIRNNEVNKKQDEGIEYKDALYDRIYRATSGKYFY